MSLYNLLHGKNPSTQPLLDILGYTEGDFGRFRSVYVENSFIVVHTRCGGGNREDYEDVFSMASDHSWYVRDEDCDFDSTYADIYFKIPEGEIQSFVAMLDQGKNPGTQWTETFKALGVPGY